MAKDEQLDLLKAIRILAFRAVQQKDTDYVYRYIMRWFSKEYHTRLTDVEELPIDYVLQHFFEARYEEMTDEEIDEELGLLVETKAEREAREVKEAQDAAADDEFLAETIAEAEAAKKAHTPLDKPLEPDAPIIPMQMLGSTQPTTFPDEVNLPGKDKPLRSLPPEIKMEFVSPDEMEEMESWDILGPPKTKDG